MLNKANKKYNIEENLKGKVSRPTLVRKYDPCLNVRTLPKIVICLLYVIFWVALLSWLIYYLSTIEPEVEEETEAPELDNDTLDEDELMPHMQRIVTLYDVVMYEFYFERKEKTLEKAMGTAELSKPVIEAVTISSNDTPNDRSTESMLNLIEKVKTQRCRNVSWLDASDNELCFKDESDAIIVYDVKANTPTEALSKYHSRQMDAKSFRISPNKKYVALLWDWHEPYRANPMYKINIRKFGKAGEPEGSEMAPVKNNSLVTHFAFAAHKQHEMTYTAYNATGSPYHYECKNVGHKNMTGNDMDKCEQKSISGYWFTWNWWWSEWKRGYSTAALCPEHAAYWNDETASCPIDLMEDEVNYKSRVNLLLYPKSEKFPYYSAMQHKYNATFYVYVDKEKGYRRRRRREISDEEQPTTTEHLTTSVPATDNPSGETTTPIDLLPSDKEDIDVEMTGPEVTSGRHRHHVEHIGRSYCRNTPNDLVSVDYTVDFTRYNTVFYSMRGVTTISIPYLPPSTSEQTNVDPTAPTMKTTTRPPKIIEAHNKFYFPSRERAFFADPPYGAVQLDTVPHILHPMVYRDPVTGLATFNMAITHSVGFSEELQDKTFGYGGFFSLPNTLRGEVVANKYRPLLSNEYYVTRILNIRAPSTTTTYAYFVAAPVRNVSRRYLYKILITWPVNGSTPMQKPECLTCPDGKETSRSEGGLEMSLPGSPPQCVWAHVEMSFNASYYTLQCRGPEVPWTAVVNTDTNLVVKNLQGHDYLRAWDERKFKPYVREFEFELDKGYICRAKLYFPDDWLVNMRQPCSRYFPLLVHVDGWPEGQLVTVKYKISWSWYLSTIANYMVLEADVRGSGFQSLNMASETWHKLGSVEIDDLLQVIKYVVDYVPCVDHRKVAVQGEGFGGYTALNVVAKDTGNLVTCCAAVSPITDFAYYSYPFGVKALGGYDVKYNRASYNEANMNVRAQGLKDKDFIIYSGTTDHEVTRFHVNNFLIALANLGITYMHQQYVDQGHRIPDYRMQLYAHMEQYFKQCFDRATKDKNRYKK